MQRLSNPNGDSSRNTQSVADELRDLLGHDVVLLRWPKGKKGARKAWRHLTAADMTPDYLSKLYNCNIGIALGRVSGGLVAIDVDHDDLVAPLMQANPFLNNTLQTHGARGRVFWIRMDGPYPERVVKLKTQSGLGAGEFRGGKNSQAIIHGVHPSGKPYEMLNKVKPLHVEFKDIVWPAEIAPPPFTPEEHELPSNDTERQSHTETEATEDTEDTEDTEAIAECGCFVRSIDHAVDLGMPDQVHQNNDCLFTLARAVKSLEANSGQFSPTQLCDVFERWYKRTKEFLRREQSRDEYLTQFMNAYASAKYGLGDGVLKRAWENAKLKPPPAEAVKLYQDEENRLVASLCRELQAIHAPAPFYLSARTLAQLLQRKSHIFAARLLKAFCGFKIIQEVEKGAGLKASRYRYLGKLE